MFDPIRRLIATRHTTEFFALALLTATATIIFGKETTTNQITWAGAVIAFLWGVYKYADTKEQENKKSFLTRQMTLCFEASDAVACLVSEGNSEKWEAARQQFWRLYYGKLCIVEDAAVASAMFALGRLIPKPEQDRPHQLPLRGKDVEDLSIQLGRAARDLVLKCWDVHLGPLNPQAETAATGSSANQK